MTKTISTEDNWKEIKNESFDSKQYKKEDNKSGPLDSKLIHKKEDSIEKK